METLSPVTLGTTLLAAFGLAYAVRAMLERRIVLRASVENQPRRQFFLDLGLCLAAGALVGLFNRIVHGFYLPSALSLLAGCLVVGFFMGLDLALVRERAIIHAALAANRNAPPPQRFYPMTRRFAVVAVCASLFICMVLAMVISRDFAWLAAAQGSAESLRQAERTVMLEVVFIMVVLLGLVVNLIMSYARNLKILFDNETRVLEQVSDGDLSQMVPVATRDEFGVIAGHTNAMIVGLRHRTELMSALALADEVQRNLLPQAPIDHPAAEVAGVSVYCSQTGGDYYDHFAMEKACLGVVVADSSGHGISAALHMTATRAFFKAGLQSDLAPEALIRSINQHLVRDSRDSGWFITLFLLVIDPRQRRLRWIRAGHDPALLYDPVKDIFQELGGEGVALGVLTAPELKEYAREGWAAGSVVVLVTDGVREARNRPGEMFGAARLEALVRRNAHEAAAVIRDRIVTELERFRGDRPLEDDATLVVVKLH